MIFTKEEQMDTIIDFIQSGQLFYNSFRVVGFFLSFFYFLVIIVLATRVDALERLLTSKYYPRLRLLLIVQLFLAFFLAFFSLFLL